MVNYYDILKVSPKATGTEIKSAYRRLARKLHPDKNQGSEETARKFAEIAEAYEVIGNPKERVKYDRRMVDATFSNSNTDSFITTMNPHARRWRQMVYEKRYNDIIDRMIAEERKEAMAFQKVVYPLVAFLVTCVLAAAFRPKIVFTEPVSPVSIIIVIALFIVGVIRIVGRLRDGFERFTEPDDDIHESILDNGERKRKPYSRLATSGVLIASSLALSALAYVIGHYVHFSIALNSTRHEWKDPLAIEFILYPPIITFLVDGMHSIVSYFEHRREFGGVSRITSD